MTHYNQTKPLDYNFSAKVAFSWTCLGMQAAVNAVRGTGATNVVLCSGIDFANDMTQWLTHAPVDPLRQMGAVWHAYLSLPATRYGGYEALEDIMAAGYPVIVTEFGDASADGTPRSVFCDNILGWMDSKNISALAWSWCYSPDISANANFALAKNSNFDPSDGYGIVVHEWLAAHNS